MYLAQMAAVLNKTKLTLNAVVISLLVFLFACGSSSTATPAATAVPVTQATAVPTAQPATASWPGIAPGGKVGGVVSTYAIANPGVWDPHRSPSGASMEHISKAYNQVLQWNPIEPGKIIGDLAQSWEATDGGNTYIFRIHPGIRWWDGKDLTAEDVAFSINRMIEPEEPRPRAGIIRTYVESAKAIDPLSVEVSLKYPAAAFFSYMASDYLKIIPKHIVEAGIEINNFDNLMGSGPFKPTEFVQGDVVRYVRNDDYFKGDLPYFEGIDSYIIVDNSRAIAAFLSGQVQMCQFPYCDFVFDEFQILEEKGADFLDVWWEPASIIGWANLNVQHPPLDDPRVQRAIYLAIDRDEIIAGVGGPIELSIGSPFPPSWSRTEKEIRQIPGFRVTADGKKDPADLAEARRLLADAGFPNGEGFPKMDMVIRTVVAVYADMGTIIKQQLKDNLGIDGIEMRLMESAAGLEAYRAGEWDMSAQFVGLINTDPEDILQQVYSEKGAWNWSRWSSPEYEDLFARQSQEQDPAKRKELIREMELFLYETPKHAIELYWKKHAWVVSKDIGGFVAPPQLVNCCMKLEHLWFK